MVRDSFELKFSLLATTRDRLAARRYSFRCLFLSVLLGLVAGSAAAGADVGNPALRSSGPGLTFAVADFDGDFHPDVASVESGANSSGATNYSIQLRLSSVGRQDIRLVGPAGGLVIEARDVNGDHAVDLVLTTAWLRQPVAVFLNNGHGGFSRAGAGPFLDAFTGPSANSVSAANLATDAVGVSPQSRAEAYARRIASPYERPVSGFVRLLADGFPANRFSVSHSGRAPPSEVSYL